MQKISAKMNEKVLADESEKFNAFLEHDGNNLAGVCNRYEGNNTS
jgi:hypothetical protein